MKNVKSRKWQLFVCMLFCAWPISFAGAGKIPWTLPSIIASLEVSPEAGTSDYRKSNIYQHLDLSSLGLSMEAYCGAIEGYEKLVEQNKVKEGIITIIDFTKPSTAKRLFVIDLVNGRLLFHSHVAHGQHSGENYATRFSNIPESFQSSLGFYQTANTYNGRNGYSLQLVGLEKGINDRAVERAIVMHGAPYVSGHYINTTGHLGRSWGCPAVPEQMAKPLINTIRGRTCLFIYANNKTYLKKSKIL